MHDVHDVNHSTFSTSETFVVFADTSGNDLDEAWMLHDQPLQALEHCSSLLAMISWYHLDSGLCQHVITFINTALVSPDGPHKGFPKCLALRQLLVTALLDKGLMRVVTDLQELVQESLFQVWVVTDLQEVVSRVLHLDMACG